MKAYLDTSLRDKSPIQTLLALISHFHFLLIADWILLILSSLVGFGGLLCLRNFVKTLTQMKKIALLVVLALAGVLTWWLLETKKKPKDETPDQQPVAVSKYSRSFINAIDTVLNNYYNLSEAFVNWDSTLLPERAKSLQSNIDKIPFDELKKDTVIYQTAITYLDGFKSDLSSIAGQADITSKRRAFNTFSDNLYNLLRVVKYDGAKVYMAECPMAFNDTEAAMWLSKRGEIRNPYLGLHHPRYKGGMLECGEIKDSLAFMALTR